MGLSWLNDLERLEVEFELLNRLAFAYQAKPDDISVSEITGNPPRRQVKRRIFNTFWFFREVLPYGDECVIIAPPLVREKFRQKLDKMNQNYQEFWV